MFTESKYTRMSKITQVPIYVNKLYKEMPINDPDHKGLGFTETKNLIQLVHT